MSQKIKFMAGADCEDEPIPESVAMTRKGAEIK